mmetsp:Transcript_115046/g.279208  ORF Transcript_115046/g.279208 Transcript_115046/m.279208 type:complete len:238 (+) Transcript_115046:19-732(+)
MARLRNLSALVACFVLVSAFHGAGTAEATGEVTAPEPRFVIEGRLTLPATVPVPPDGLPSTKISVNGGEFTTYTRSDGTFKVPDVPAGRHMVEAYSREYVFPVARLQITEKGERAVYMYRLPGSERVKGKHPLQMEAIMPANFFEVREPFNIFGMLKSPMVIMMLVMVGMIVCMPKMMDNMDPEQKKEMEEMQAKMGGGGGDIFSMLKEAMGTEEEKKAPSRVENAPFRAKRSKHAR